ncbi:MAG: vitamin B12-dependent ribonucleotide reductase [bacterium]|nr:vitamin B12-dependent ribonucleotide reductase [bacterium]
MKTKTKPRLSDASLEVLKRRYLLKDDNGKIIEKPEGLFKRVATHVAQAEKKYSKGPGAKKTSDQFYEMISSLDFLPNSPTLMNAGRELGQLSACFVLPVGDNMGDIFGTIKNTALIHQSGGGTGFSFSRLREKGARVKSTSGVASGPISFMTAFNAATETVKQGGTRRGANMGMLRIDHPDIMDFITCKEDNGAFNNFNISVAITEKFMKAVEKDKDYDLISPLTGKKTGSLNAREVFDIIVKQAWKNGEPGIVFIDRMNKDNPTPKIGEIESTNPCGEQPLLPYESCNLGSINLSNFVEDGEVDWRRLKETTRWAVRFLDDVIDMNKYPIDEISEMTRANRKIGLGVMGFADMLVQLEIPYNTDEAVSAAEEVMKFIQEEGRKMSEELAKERGIFPNWKDSIYGDSKQRVRNATVTTIAPTGSISMIADASSGVEPLFAVSFIKNVMDKDELVMTNPIFLSIAKRMGFYSEELMKKIAKSGTLEGIDEVPDEVKRVFVVAHDVSPLWHLKIQAAIQKYTDNAVSKTVNFGHSATKKDVAEVYKLAYDLGCKGVTIYRDGSREEQVLNIGKVNKKGVQEEKIDPTKRVVRQRARVTYGRTIQIMTGCGKLYVTVNEDEEGRPFELFSAMGKAGGCAASQAEAISRMVSTSLRSGIEPKIIIKHLKSIACHRPFGFGPDRITSCSDAIARALESFISPPTLGIVRDQSIVKEQEQLEIKIEEVSTQTVKPEIKRESYIGGICRECGGPIEYEGGCMVCRSCGYSECG